MNTKHIKDKAERKSKKRAARKAAAPIGPRAADVARGSQKRKVKKMVKGSVSGRLKRSVGQVCNAAPLASKASGGRGGAGL